MPNFEIKYDFSSMLKNIESCQKGLKRDEFDSLSDEKKRQLYAEIFASRSAANCQRDKKSTLKVRADVKDWEKKRNELITSATFQSFITKQGHGKMKQLLTTGHGGAAEDEFEKYVMDMKQLPADVPERSMPTAEKRIEDQQKKLEGMDAASDEAINAYAEIFRARRSVDAERNKVSGLRVKINGQAMATQPDLFNNNTFRAWVHKNPNAVKQAMTTGHGGAAEDQFKDYLKNIEHLPSDTPNEYMPTALDRTAVLVSKIKAGGEIAEQCLRCTELMATREAVGAERGKSKSLEPRLNAESLASAYEKWSKCQTFQNFLENEPDKALAGAKQGHGGALSDAFKEHVLNLDHIPQDVPENHMPNADKRLEALKDKFKAANYTDSSDERKLDLAIEVMATREAVNAQRNTPKSLEKPVNADTLREKVEKWKNCKTFTDFVKAQPEKVRDGASAGHGGKLGDHYKQFLINVDVLDKTVPAEFMPNANVRLEAIQEQIEKDANETPEKRAERYAELIATRSAVNAVRKKSKSLETQIDPAILEEHRQKLLNSKTFKNFINDENQAADLRKAALEGHGGALEDKFKEYVKNQPVIGEDVPARFMPTALERTEALQAKMKEPGFDESENRADLFVELMATRDAVGAVRGKADSLKVPVDPALLAQKREQWKKCESFKSFVTSEDTAEDAKKAAAAGHGGALLDKFKEHVKGQEILPEDLPDEVVPTAKERIDALKKQIGKSFDEMEPDERTSWIAQIMASRQNVNAVRNKEESLDTKIDPKAVNNTAQELMESGALDAFIKANPKAAKSLATSGHGGELEEKFREFVKGMDVLPDKLPARYVPTAYDRLEGLKDKVKGNEFQNKTTEEKIGIYAEIIGTRRSVNAERNKPDLLKCNMDPARAREESKKLAECSAFQEYCKANPDKVRDLAKSGHGGALEEDFKKYVLNLDHIPEDVPQSFMPTARERTEVLQKKIDSAGFASKTQAEQDSLYRELMATRASVNSIRGDKNSLNTRVNAEKLNSIRSEMSKSRGLSEFLSETDRPSLRKAALKGHGGALEDIVKEGVVQQTVKNGTLPDHLPNRYVPKVSVLREKLRESFVKDLKSNTAQSMNLNKDQYKKKVAASMYLTVLEKKAGNEEPKLNSEAMEKNVNRLSKSKAFDKMFEQSAATHTIVSKIAAKRMSEVMENFSSKGGTFAEPQPQPQPVLQNQPVQQRNQPVQQQNQPVQQQNQPNRQQNGEVPNQQNRPQQRPRVNSMRQNQNRPAQNELQNEPQRRRANSLRREPEQNQLQGPGLQP